MIQPAAILQTSNWIVTFVIAHHRVFDSLTEIVTACSIVHTLLPPWDWDPAFVRVGLIEFPTAQKAFHALFNNRWYRILVYIIGFVALNARSTIWRYISVNNPAGPNANQPATVVETVTAEKVVIPSAPASGGAGQP
jgi:hypothetical protein